jgi:hypothetical protein
MRVPRRHILRIPAQRDAEATLLHETKCAEPPSTCTMIQFIEHAIMDE